MRKLYGIGLGLVLVVAAITVALTSVAGAGDGNGSVRAVLNGYHEVVGPGSISTVGSGVFEARINEQEQTITYRLRYTLENAATQAHIHFAQRHVGGGVSAFLCGGGGQDPCPPGTAERATVTGVITPAQVIGPASQGIEAGSFNELVRAIRAGATYANVHSTRWPAGEIRGQIADDDEEDDEEDD